METQKQTEMSRNYTPNFTKDLTVSRNSFVLTFLMRMQMRP